MAKKSFNMDWRKDMVDEGFSQEIGKCIEVDVGADFGGSDGGIDMRMKICRIAEDELEANGSIDYGDGDKLTTFNSRYRRNVSQ
jgi:hypothetical protein